VHSSAWAGVIASIKVAQGARVQTGDVLVEFE
jgi:biotin carboxyl carrier protein